MPHKLLANLIQSTYPSVAQAYPGEGRRKRVLRALHAGWPRPVLLPSSGGDDDVELVWEELDTDPLDAVIAQDPESPGILLRTDFSNDSHWETFVQRMKESEKEVLDAFRPGGEADEPLQAEDAPSHAQTSSSTQDVEMGDDAQANEGFSGEESDEEDNEGLPQSIITPFNPPPTSHALFANISNLTALRLLNDVDIRPALPPPKELAELDELGLGKYKKGKPKAKGPNNVLIDHNGWQEVYEGKNLWIYDSKSLEDGCVRVVEQAGQVHGAATGDSWRARMTHIPELQFNMSFLGMKIDFGGLDRWDAQERARNLADAAVL